MSAGLRIGAIVPSSNPVVEPELQRLVRDLPDVEVLASRLAVERISLDKDSAKQFSPESFTASASLLREVDPDVVVWAGTSGSWLGRTHETRVVEALERALGAPATTSTLSLIDACRAYSATKVHLVSPYVDEVVADIISCYADFGLDVVSEAHLGITENRAFAAVPREIIRSLAVSADPAAQAVVICCTNLRGAAVVADLESEMGCPVFDSVSATLWGAFSRCGAPYTVRGAGTLLAQGTLRALLNTITEGLLESVAADRVTVRVDLAAFGLEVDRAAAEARRAGVASIANDASINQRALETIVWLEESRRPLVQARFDSAPFPPAALLGVYGVRAQMLGPIEYLGQLIGWLSVHQLAERDWRAADVTALEAACVQALTVLKPALEHGQSS